jgi:DNA (cytosine-5)-methyltransferase 1
VASNHWPIAVETHARNHPETEHVCQDLRQADWTSLPRFDLLLASPACQGHSQASQPKRRAFHDDDRATAWSVVDCADVTSPRALIVENVLELRRWRLFPDWCSALRRLGYSLSEHVATATDYGVPQRRTRLIVVGLKSGRRIELPANSIDEPPIGPMLEAGGDWKDIGECQPAARARILNALERSGSPCLVQHVTGHPGVPLHEPIRTITTKVQWTLAERRGSSVRYRWLEMREVSRGMGFPDSYTWDESLPKAVVHRGLGNAVPPPMARGVVAAVMEAA